MGEARREHHAHIIWEKQWGLVSGIPKSRVRMRRQVGILPLGA